MPKGGHPQGLVLLHDLKERANDALGGGRGNRERQGELLPANVVLYDDLSHVLHFFGEWHVAAAGRVSIIHH